jgi:predicted RNase H-like nuclease (RuvC/YqgF family)
MSELDEAKKEIKRLKSIISQLQDEIETLEREKDLLSYENDDCDECGDCSEDEDKPVFFDEYRLRDIVPERLQDFAWVYDTMKRFAESL